MALAREPGEAADSEPAADLTDALLELRAARERLRRVDSILAALLAEIGRRLPRTRRSRPNTPAGRLPCHAQTLETPMQTFAHRELSASPRVVPPRRLRPT